VYNSYGPYLFTAETATHQWIRRTAETEQNLIYAAVNLKQAEVRLIIEDCTQRIVLLKLTTDRHEASRGLSATQSYLHDDDDDGDDDYKYYVQWLDAVS